MNRYRNGQGLLMSEALNLLSERQRASTSAVLLNSGFQPKQNLKNLYFSKPVKGYENTYYELKTLTWSFVSYIADGRAKDYWFSSVDLYTHPVVFYFTTPPESAPVRFYDSLGEQAQIGDKVFFVWKNKVSMGKIDSFADGHIVIDQLLPEQRKTNILHGTKFVIVNDVNKLNSDMLMQKLNVE